MSFLSWSRHWGALWLVVCLASSAWAQSPALPVGVSKVQTVEGITEYRLNNGLKVLLAPDVADERVNVQMTYMVGARHEGYGEGGMAHLLEHMIFKGTPTTPDPKAEFRKRGFTYNGTTNHDRTNYFATFVSNQESLDWYIAWQADAMLNSHVSRKDLDSEMTVVRNEFEIAGNNAYRALHERLMAATYTTHNYGKPVIGNRADIERVDIAQLQSFYHRYYRPDNAVLLVAGNFDVAQTLAAIQKSFGPLARPAQPVAATYTLEPVQDGERSVVVRRPATAQTLLLSYRTPGALHPDTVPLSVLQAVLNDAPSGRLHKALVESKLAQSASSSRSAQREAGTLSVQANFGPDDEAATRQKILLDIAEGLDKQPITQEEFDRAKTLLVKGLELGFTNAAGVANGAIAQEVMGDWRAIFVYRDRMKAVTLDDVNRVAATYLLPSNRVLVHLIPTALPQRAPEPQALDIAAFTRGYTFSEKGMESVAFDFSTASLFDKVVFGQTPGGMRTAILSKPVRGDVVTIRINFKHGSLDALRNQDATASMANAMLFMGTNRLNRQQIKDQLVQMGAALHLGFGETGGSMSLTVKKDQVPAAFALAIHLLKDSTFPAAEFEEVRAAQLKASEGQIKDRSAQAGNAWRRYGNPYPKGDTRYTHTLEEWRSEIESVTREQSYQFYKSFYGAQHAQVSIVGPVDTVAYQKMIAEALDTWQAPQSWSRVPHPLVERKPTRLVFDTPDKTNVTLQAYQGMAVAGRNFNPQEFAMSLGSRIFGGGAGSRLWVRMREKGGLSYSTSASFSASYFDVSAQLNFHAEVAPENLSKAEAALQEELNRSIQDGFTAQEVETFKTQWLADRKRGRSGDQWALSFMHGRMEYEEPKDAYERSDALIGALTAEQVNATWRQFVKPDQLVWGVFGDQSKFK